MSEHSESYHIWTEDAARTLQRLRMLRTAGLVFGPRNSWLTFVPYEHSAGYRNSFGHLGFARELSRGLDATVLYYLFSEDYGWSFGLYASGRSELSRERRA